MIWNKFDEVMPENGDWIVLCSGMATDYVVAQVSKVGGRLVLVFDDAPNAVVESDCMDDWWAKLTRPPKGG
jgi:hypothetical protein